MTIEFNEKQKCFHINLGENTNHVTNKDGWMFVCEVKSSMTAQRLCDTLELIYDIQTVKAIKLRKAASAIMEFHAKETPDMNEFMQQFYKNIFELRSIDAKVVSAYMKENGIEFTKELKEIVYPS